MHLCLWKNIFYSSNVLPILQFCLQKKKKKKIAMRPHITSQICQCSSSVSNFILFDRKDKKSKMPSFKNKRKRQKKIQNGKKGWLKGLNHPYEPWHCAFTSFYGCVQCVVCRVVWRGGVHGLPQQKYRFSRLTTSRTN